MSFLFQMTNVTLPNNNSGVFRVPHIPERNRISEEKRFQQVESLTVSVLFIYGHVYFL